MAADSGASGGLSECYQLPAYLRAPEVTCKVMAEYIWLGAGGQLRSKTKVLDSRPAAPEEAPVLVAQEGCADAGEAVLEVFLKPRKLFRDPFRGGDHVLVLCDTFRPTAGGGGEAEGAPPVVLPTPANTRVACVNVLKVAEQSQPVFAAEQQYAVAAAAHPAFQPARLPLGLASSRMAGGARRRRSPERSSSRGCDSSCTREGRSVPVPARRAATAASWPPCGVGAGGALSDSLSWGSPAQSGLMVFGSFSDAGGGGSSSFCCGGSPTWGGGSGALLRAAAQQPTSTSLGRSMSEAHLRCCLFAGVSVTGADAGGQPDAPPGVQSYKVGPCQGVDFGDQLWTSRYLLQRVAEDHGAAVSWHPDAAAALGGPQLGCSIKFSTAETRDPEGGLVALQEQVGRLQAGHLQHLAAYHHHGRLNGAPLMAALPGLTAAAAAGFTHAIGSGGASVTVPVLTLMRKSGYLVDHRPPSDADPYSVAMMLASTTLGVPLPPQLHHAQQRRAWAAGPAATGLVAPAAQPAFGSIAAAGRAGLQAQPALGHGSHSHTYGDDISDITFGEQEDILEDGHDDCDDSEAGSMDTTGSYDLLLDELQRMDKGTGGDGEDDEDKECSGDEGSESSGEYCDDGTSPDRSPHTPLLLPGTGLYEAPSCWGPGPCVLPMHCA